MKWVIMLLLLSPIFLIYSAWNQDEYLQTKLWVALDAQSLKFIPLEIKAEVLYKLTKYAESEPRCARCIERLKKYSKSALRSYTFLIGKETNMDKTLTQKLLEKREKEVVEAKSVEEARAVM